MNPRIIHCNNKKFETGLLFFQSKTHGLLRSYEAAFLLRILYYIFSVTNLNKKNRIDIFQTIITRIDN